MRRAFFLGAVGALGVLADCSSSDGAPVPPSADAAAADDTGSLPDTGPPPDSGPPDLPDAGAKVVAFEDACWSGQNAIVGTAAGRSGVGCSVCRSNPGLPFGLNSGGSLGHVRSGVAYTVEAWVSVASPSPGLTTWVRAEEESGASHVPSQTVDGPTLGPDATWQKVTGQLTATASGDLLDVLVMGNLDDTGSSCFVVDDVTIYGPLD